MVKKTYRVRNWKEYNKALISRGSITVWVDEKSIHTWYESCRHPHKRGRPQTYSDSAILTLLLLKQVYRLPLRACQGFAHSILVDLLKLPLKIPVYSQLCRRQGGISLPPLPKSVTPIHLVIDSSGLKIYGEGEWKVRQHGYAKRRTWRKLHIGINTDNRLIVTELLTENNCSDDQQLPVLIDQYTGMLRQVSLDGAYDSHACFDKIHQRSAKPVIPTQPHPLHKPKRLDNIKRIRDQAAWEIQELGRANWKQQSDYHQRSLVENAFYRFKQIFGDKLSSRQLAHQKTEAFVRCCALNKMTEMGMPISESI